MVNQFAERKKKERQEKIAEAIRLWKEQGLSVAILAERTKLGVHAIRNAFRKEGICVGGKRTKNSEG